MAYRAGCPGTVLGAVIWQLAGRARSPGSKRDLSIFQTSRRALLFTKATFQFIPAVFSSGIKRVGRKFDPLFLSDSEDDKDEQSYIWFYDVRRDKFEFTFS